MPISFCIRKTTYWRPQNSIQTFSFCYSSLSDPSIYFSVDWNVDQTVIVPPPAPKESKLPATKPKTPPPIVTPIDPELEKRRKRAERFGIPFVEPKKPTTSDVGLFLFIRTLL